MVLAGTTMLLVAFLLPGMAFFVGLYAVGGHARDAGRPGALAEIAVALLVAGLVHLSALVLLLEVASSWVSWTLHPLVILHTLDTLMAWEFLRARLSSYLIYLMGVTVFGGLLGLGLAAGLRIARGRRRVSGAAGHGWAHDLVRPRRGAGVYVACDVATDILDEAGRPLAYTGELAHLDLSRDGALARLVLKRATARPAGPSRDRSGHGPGDKSAPAPPDGAARSYLVIEGRSVRSVLFERTDIVVAGVDDARALERAVAAAAE